MLSTLTPIPNSNGVSTILSLFSHCFTFLKNARPLPQTAHAVTSVITPQAGSSFFSKTPFLIFAGAAAVLGTAYLFKTRYFPKPSPSDDPSKNPPDGLSKKNTTVVNAQEVARADTVRAAPPAGDDQREADLPPPPVVQAASASAAPPAGNDQREADLPPSQVLQAASASAAPPAGDDQRGAGLPPPQVLQAASASAAPPAGDDQRGAGLPPPQVLQAASASAAPPAGSDKQPAQPPSPNASPISSERSSASSSSDALEPIDSDSDSDSEDPSPLEQPSRLGSLAATVINLVMNPRHFSKWKKYRLIQDQLEQFARTKNIHYYRSERNASITDVEIAEAWNNLVTALLNPTKFKTADEQYRATVKCLRKIRLMLVSADDKVKQKFLSQFQFVRELSSFRFTGIKLFPYCKELVELASNKRLPENLTLGTFLPELQARTVVLNNPASDYAMNGIACEVNKAKGACGVDFDPLLKTSDIPYQDGVISINGRTTVLLWHGTPVTHHDLLGLGFDLVQGVFDYIPFLNNLLPKRTSVATDPVINADYISMIEQAGVEGKNILHVILENGTKKIVGDESSRVKARLRLGIHNPNMFVMAFRLDEAFFERRDIGLHAVEPVQSLKDRLSRELLMPLLEAQDMSASTLQTRQMEDHLAKNGFCIPQKVRRGSELPEHMGRLLDEVHQIYFPDFENITTVAEHQAFSLLSYVHIILFICWKLNIDILEIFCKNDKDRGNVLKTLFKLHFLYLTGQDNHETLTAVLVHTLARPFILQKNAMIKSRLVLLERAIPFIKKAKDREPNPKTFLYGGVVQSASYHVAKPAGQTIYPSNAASKTIEEYMAFIENPPAAPIVCNGNPIEELSRNCYREGQRQDDFIQTTVSASARSMNISVGGSLLEAPPSQNDDDHDDPGVHTSILTYLRDTCKLSEEEAWKVSCAFQPALGQGQLDQIFSNRVLGISIKLDESTGSNSMNLIYENGAPKIELGTICKISDRTGAIARIKVSLTMADARTGQAQLTYGLLH